MKKVDMLNGLLATKNPIDFDRDFKLYLIEILADIRTCVSEANKPPEDRRGSATGARKGFNFQE